MRVYYSNGVPSVDADSNSLQQVQGLTLAVFIEDESGNVTTGQFSSDGKPYYGYKAKRLTDEEAALWQSRITGAAQAGEHGHKDEGGTWFPGRIGRGRSVIDSAGWSVIQKQDAEIRTERARIGAEQDEKRQSIAKSLGIDWSELKELLS
jgi:hypothetical protein